MRQYVVQDIVEGLKGLGLMKGDVVLVRAALRTLGDLNQKRSLVLLRAFIDVVGSEGTIIGLAHNRFVSFAFTRPKKDYIVTAQTQPETGGFAIEMLKFSGSLRSQHPTNSFVAIGRLSTDIIDGHDANSTCFRPIQKLIEQNGKMILIGCVESSPGFSTVHLAQEELGLATRSILSGRQGVYYKENNEVQLFRRMDIPGCSNGFYKMYSHYLREGKLKVGFVGDAYSIAINAKDAFDIDYRILKKNPRYIWCDNPDCYSCHGTHLYDASDIPRLLWFYTTHLPKIIRNIR
jgi:aminoglycoside 3-N-acetyltransferase